MSRTVLAHPIVIHQARLHVAAHAAAAALGVLAARASLHRQEEDLTCWADGAVNVKGPMVILLSYIATIATISHRSFFVI